MPGTVATRLAPLLAHVPDLPVRELERLAGLKRGALQKVIDGESVDPRGSTLVGAAVVLGTTSDYLSADIGDPPNAQRVKRSVRAARAEWEAEHRARVRTAR